MSNRNIIRAWKDPSYRNQLSSAERAALPENPAGAVEIFNEDLSQVAGGIPPRTRLCCLTDLVSCYPSYTPTWCC